MPCLLPFVSNLICIGLFQILSALACFEFNLYRLVSIYVWLHENLCCVVLCCVVLCLCCVRLTRRPIYKVTWEFLEVLPTNKSPIHKKDLYQQRELCHESKSIEKGSRLSICHLCHCQHDIGTNDASLVGKGEDTKGIVRKLNPCGRHSCGSGQYFINDWRSFLCLF